MVRSSGEGTIMMRDGSGPHGDGTNADPNQSNNLNAASGSRKPGTSHNRRNKRNLTLGG